MLGWPEWSGEQNNYVYFCLIQHIKSDVEVKAHSGMLSHYCIVSVGDVQSVMHNQFQEFEVHAIKRPYCILDYQSSCPLRNW